MFVQSNDVHFLSKKEQNMLLSKIDNLKHKLLVFLMMDAGLRVSEACTLKLSNFNFKSKTLTVRSLKRRETSKKLFRTIPLSDRLYLILADYLYNNKQLTKDDYLFPSGDAHLSRDAANKFLSRINHKLNIKNLHPHALRHTFATNHIATGTPLENVKEMLGHERYDTTLIYTHIPVELLRSNIQAVAGAGTKRPWFFRVIQMFNPKEPKIINIATTSNGLSIGRTDVIAKVENLANRDINILIQGDIGIGKSHVLEHLSLNKKILKLDDTDNIRVSLIFMLLYLYKNDKEAIKELLYSDLPLDQVKVRLNRLSVRGLCEEIKKVVKPKEFVLLIDCVDRITPKSIKTLEELKDTFTIITSAREIPINKNSFLWNFEIIKMKPLERRFALELINRLSYDLEVEDFELFRNHVYEQTNGNPRAMYEIIERYRKEPVITSDVVRDIRHYGSMKEIDMSLIVIIGLASLAVLRYVSREVDNDAYRFIGGASLIALIIFRYFFSYTKRKFV